MYLDTQVGVNEALFLTFQLTYLNMLFSGNFGFGVR